MKSASTAGLVAIVWLIQQAVATSWGDSPTFSSVSNTNNSCTTDQQSGFDWSGLPTGSFNNYGGFGFSGFSCQDSFQPNAKKRSLRIRDDFQSKCIQGKVSTSSNSGPTFSCSQDDQFSITHMQVSVSFDTDLDFIFSMPDGSTCKHTASCSASGTTVENTQCGGAKSVSFQMPPSGSSNGCDIGIHSIGFDCNDSSSSSSSSSTTTAPASSTTSASVVTTTTPVVTSTSLVRTTTTTPGVDSTTTPQVIPVTSSSTTTTSSSEQASTSTTSPLGSTTTTPDQTPSTTTTSPVGQSSTSSTTATTTPQETPDTTTTTPSIEQTTSSSTTSSQQTTTTSAIVTTTAADTTPGTSSTETTTDLITTEIVVTTLTTCPITNTRTSGTETASTLHPIYGYTSCYHGDNFSIPIYIATFITSNILVHRDSTSKPATLVTCFASTVSDDAAGITVFASVFTASSTVDAAVTVFISAFLISGVFATSPASSTADVSLSLCAPLFISSVQECVSAWGSSDDEVTAALSYLAGICADFVPQNPGICTGVPRTITLVPTPAPAGSVTETVGTQVQTVTNTGTVTATVTNGNGRGPRPPLSGSVSGASNGVSAPSPTPPVAVPVTTVTFTVTASGSAITSAVTVPQVTFVTVQPTSPATSPAAGNSGNGNGGGPGEVGLVPMPTTPPAGGSGSYGSGFGDGSGSGSGSGSLSSDGGAEAAATTFVPGPTGSSTDAGVPSITPDIFTGAATKQSVAWGVLAGILGLLAFVV
ncbi:hypothetical protein AYO22_00172 [Fonsecaea multimorphosa]|nr:hypothetical protein AYO22_00172 [Fonsecaea multimorphosa]